MGMLMFTKYVNEIFIQLWTPCFKFETSIVVMFLVK